MKKALTVAKNTYLAITCLTGTAMIILFIMSMFMPYAEYIPGRRREDW